MHVQKKDLIASSLVAAAGLLYLLWATDAALPGMRGTRATGIVILGLGFAASASAVVPTFGQLLHGNKGYLAATSLIGLMAAIAGVHMLVTASATSLAIVMVAMLVLWMIATVHHSLEARSDSPQRRAPLTPPAGDRRLVGRGPAPATR